MKYSDVQSYFEIKGISFNSESQGRELRITCPFCKNEKNKCYVNNSTGEFYCFHCGSGGKWERLLEGLGKPVDGNIEVKEEPEEEFELPPIDSELVEGNQERLVAGVGKPILEDYFYAKRGYTDATITKFKLGWDGKHITIPVFNANGECVNFRLKRDPTLPSDGSKRLFSIPGRGKKRLFNEAILRQKPKFIIICEGEWDCMLLDQYGYASITSTGGALSFDASWVDAFVGIEKIYVCYDNDTNDTGQRGTLKVTKLFQEKGIETYIVNLPKPKLGYEEKIDVTSFFVDHKKTKAEFDELLNKATPANKLLKKHGERQSKDTEKINYALDLPNVIDVLDAGETLVYLTTGNKIVKIIEYQGKLYVPPPKENCPYLFANREKVMEYIKSWNDSENEKLYTDLTIYHKEISDLPDEDLYELLVLWDFHIYLLEKCHFSPMLYFYAVKERGKSRTVKGLAYLARRGIFTETVREANIIRWGNDHRAVLGFDVKDFPKKIAKVNCDDLILSRFERGAISSRTLWPERGAFRDTKNFKLFGATAIATNRPIDDTLESRTIAISMKPTDRTFHRPVLPEDALALKCRLTAFRAVYFDKQLVETEKPATGRLGDITLPLYQIMLTFFPNKESLFMRVLRKVKKQKQEEATDTLEAQILEAVINLEEQVEDGKLSVDVITTKLNEGKKDNFAISNQTIGQILKGLGFDKRRITGGKRGIYYDSTFVKKLAMQYGISDGSDESDDEQDMQEERESGDTDRGVEDGNSISQTPSLTSLASEASTIKSPETCKICGSRKFWKTQGNSIVCAVCHPPVSKEQVMEWFEEK